MAFRCPLVEDQAGAFGKRKGFKFLPVVVGTPTLIYLCCINGFCRLKAGHTNEGANRKGIPTAAKKGINIHQLFNKLLAMKNIKLYILYFLLLISLNSCKTDSKIKILTDDSIKFWDEYDITTLSRIGAFSFEKNEKCKSYVYNSKGERRIFYSGDVLFTDSSWSFKGDTILSMEGFDRRILKLQKDTILLQNIKTNDSILLISSPLSNR